MRCIPNRRNSISIHAPREGSDVKCRLRFGQRVDFNPRSPRGERLQILHPALAQSAFQSTLPARGATTCVSVIDSDYRDFNPRSPRGERPRLRLAPDTSIGFQSTLPARGATMYAELVQWQSTNFNPRSPRGERRLTKRKSPKQSGNFNPRSPRGERRMIP